MQERIEVILLNDGSRIWLYEKNVGYLLNTLWRKDICWKRIEKYKKNKLRKRAEESLGKNKFHTKGNKNIKNWG